MFISVDPLADKYPGISGYAYCLNNPMKYIDPDGRDEWDIDGAGKKLAHRITTEHDQINVLGEKGNRSITFEHGTITANSQPVSPGGKPLNLFEVKGDDNAAQLFEFLADPESTTNVEWTHAKTGIVSGQDGSNVVGTSHSEISTVVGFYLRRSKYILREVNHNHTNNDPFPSYEIDQFGNEIGDMPNANAYGNIPLNIYTKKWGYSPYNSNGTLDNRILLTPSFSPVNINQKK